MLGQWLHLIGLFFILIKRETSKHDPGKVTQNALCGKKPEFLMLMDFVV
jgi:hypothetical protein